MADKVKSVEGRLIQDCFPWRTFRAMPLPFAASFLPNWYPMWTTTFAPAPAENTELWSATGLPIFLTCQFAQTSTTGDRCDYKSTLYTPIITISHITFQLELCWLSFVKIAELEVLGKSFGGSGVAHAMLDQKCSDSFKPLGNVVKPPFLEIGVTPACASPWLRYFLLGSPSLAWDNRAFFRLEQESYTSRNPLNAMVYASCGGKEQGQIQNLQDFKQLLDSRAYPDLSITTEIVEGRQQLKLSVSRFCLLELHTCILVLLCTVKWFDM